MDRVYVGHVIPLMKKEGEQLWATEADLEIFDHYIEELKSKLKIYVSSLMSRGVSNPIELLSAVADFIVCFYKLPLTSSITPPGIKVVSIPSPNELFWIWVLGRYVNELRNVFESKEFVITDLNLECLMNFVKTVLHKPKCMEEIFYGENGLFNLSVKVDSSLKQLSQKVFSKIPADTRPGSNTSKLIPHLLTTSALASVLYASSRVRGQVLDDKEKLGLALVRIASLLHDVGKPKSWIEIMSTKSYVDHADVSAQMVVNLLKEVLSSIEGSSEIIEAIEQLVRCHHKASELADLTAKILDFTVDLGDLVSLISEADRLSSSVDRLIESVADTVAGVLGERTEAVQRMLKESGRDVWKYWLEKSDNLIARASIEAARKLFLQPTAELKSKPVKKPIYISIIDVRGIQRFVLRENLRLLGAASYIIDAFVQYAIPRALIEGGVMLIPPEAVIYAGGGLMLFISGKSLDSSAVDAIRDRAVKLLGLVFELKVVGASTVFDENWSAALISLFAKLASAKALLEQSPSRRLLLEFGVEALCDGCGVKIATTKIDERYLCNECNTLKIFGENFHFKSKIKLFEGTDYGVPSWEDEPPKGLRCGEYILEWLSGLSEFQRKYYNVAVVKIDGNMMGAFMTSATSITDALERSIRIDYALKRGLYELMCYLRDLNVDGERAIKHAARVYVGTLYAGGDDALFIWPAWLAIPGALIIAYWFWREMGGVRQVSIGVTSGKAKFNIWSLISCSEELLKKSKSALRRELSQVKDGSALASELASIVAVISMLYSDVQSPLPSWIDELLTPSNFSNQPYVLTVEDKLFKFLGSMNEVIDIVVEEPRGNSTLELYLAEKVLKSFFKSFSDLNKLAKDVRSIVREIYDNASSIAKTKNVVEISRIASLYSLYKHSRVEAEDVRSRVYKLIAAMASRRNFSVPIPLYDLFMLAKFALGGK